MTKANLFSFIERESDDPKQRNAGVVDIFVETYTPDQFKLFHDDVKESPNGKRKDGTALEKYYRSWRTYQFSDHMPMWVRIETNDSDSYLEKWRTSLRKQLRQT